jgi:hypothetical protein
MANLEGNMLEGAALRSVAPPFCSVGEAVALKNILVCWVDIDSFYTFASCEITSAKLQSEV